MIVINKQLAKVVVANAIASGRVNQNSTPKAYLIQANVHLNKVYDADKDKDKEIAAAEAIHWLIAYLEKLNCKDIEQLLMDVAKYRKVHPDYPRGQWPWP